MKASPAHVFSRGAQLIGQPDGRAAVPACIVPLSDQAAFLMFDCAATAAALPRGGMLGGTLDGLALPRPMISCAAELVSGRVRKVVLLRRSAAALAAGQVALHDGVQRVAFVDPDWLQSPLRDLADLVSGLAPEGQQRLLRLVLNGAPAVLGRADGRGLGPATRGLLDLLNVACGPLVARCPVGEVGQILSYRLPDGMSDGMSGGLASLVALDGDRVHRMAAPHWCAEAGNLLHVFLPRPAPALPDLVAPGGQAVVLAAGAAPPALQPFAAWLRHRPEPARAWAEDLLHTAAESDSLAAAVLRDHVLGRAHRPAVTLPLVARTRLGLLLWADVQDPYRLAAALRIEGGGTKVDLPIPASGQIRAHVALPAGQGGAAAHRIRIVHASGQVRSVLDQVPARFDGSLPAAIAPDLPEAAGRALAAAWPARFAAASAPTIQDVAVSDQTALRLIGPLPASADMIRARAALVACEPDGAGVQIVYTVDGQPSAATRRLIAETARIYGVSHRLIVFPDRRPAAEALVAALALVRDAPVLLMGADVLPQAPGWLPFWLERLAPAQGVAMVGGVLLGVDGAVEHAGRVFLTDDPDHPAGVRYPGKGLPARDLADAPEVETDSVSPDAVGLSAEAVEQVVAAGAVSPDPEALLHLALAGSGGLRLALRERFIRFAPPPPVDPAIVQAGLWQVAAARDAARTGDTA